MKKHEMTIQQILAMMATGENLPSRVDADGEDAPTSDAERLEAYDALVRITQDLNNVQARCGACEQDVPITACAPCVCGQFICEACQRQEEDGVCSHEPVDSREA
jgi:hypothetical protein